MRPWRDRCTPPLVVATFLLVWASSTLADSGVEAPVGADRPDAAAATSEGETESEAEKLRASFESLRETHSTRLSEIAALESDATTAVGEDQTALRGLALELMLEGASTLQGMWTLIEQMREADDISSTQDQAGVLAALAPQLRTSIQSAYQRQAENRDRLNAQLAELTEAEALSALETTIDRKQALLLEILEAGVDVRELAAAVGVPDRLYHDWLRERMLRRTRLAMSQISLTRAHLNEIEDREASGADPAAIQALRSAESLRHLAALGNLESSIGLLERLEIDVTGYRRMLVESTGEVTIDAIDRDVAGELITRWTSNFRDGIEENGAQFAFQALLFAVIVMLFWGLSRFVRGLVSRLVEAPHLRFSRLLKRMLVSLSTGTVLITGFLVALSQMGIEIAPMLAGLGIAGFVLGFALQDTLGNFASGIMILIYRPYDVEDMIDCAGGVFGKVSQMSLVSTTILTIDNKTLIVPNSKIWGDVITNVTAQAIRRIDLEFGIGYSDDIPHAEKVLWSIIEDHPKVLADPEPVVKVHSLGDSSVNFVVRPWVARDDYWDVHWDFMREVKLRFDREGVSIPFPQRDVHFYPSEPPSTARGDTSSEDAPPLEVGSTQLSAHDDPESEDE